TGEVKGQVTDTQGVHGIAIATQEGKGYVSAGKTDDVTVFDLKTLKHITTVKVGKKPDAIIYDGFTHRVFAFNGDSSTASAINAATDKVEGTVELGGGPESAVTDGTGHIYVNLEDKGEVLKIDSKQLKVVERRPVAPAKEPVGLAIDTQNNR